MTNRSSDRDERRDRDRRSGARLQTLNSHNNFLLHSGYLSRNSRGHVEVDIPEGYGSVEVYVLTPQTAIKTTHHIDNSPAPPTKDLTHTGLNETAEDKGWAMSRKVEPLKKGEVRIVSRDSQWRTVGLSDIFEFANTRRVRLYPWSSHLLNWHSYSFDKKNEIYDKECCHELNTFIKFKDPGYFSKVVEPFISNKLNKTFVDLALLGDIEALHYCSVEKFQQLNAFEQALLVHVMHLKGEKYSEVARAIVESF